MVVKKKSRPRRLILFLSFLIPFSILLLSYFIMQFWPVGDRSPLTIDLYHQYASFITEFRRKIMEGESLFYSWSVGLGTNFWALMAYYAASPLNLLLVFFPPEHITAAVTFLIVTKIGLSGLTFASLLSYGLAPDGLYTIRAKESKRDCTSEDLGTDAMIVALSTAYALCSFNLAYSWDIMWLDVIALLPLVILGLHKLIREQKFVLYTLSLAASLYINYYIAFFVCIFTALYFFVSYVSAKAAEDDLSGLTQVSLLNGEKIYYKSSDRTPDKQSDKLSGDTPPAAPHDTPPATASASAAVVTSATPAVSTTETSGEPERATRIATRIKFWPTVARFAFFTLLAVAISAILLLPTALSLRDTSAAGDAFPTTLTLRFSLFDFMTQQLMNIPPSIRDGLPNVYNGILVFVFVPLYIASQRIALKEKIAHLLLLAFLFISFNLNALDFMWHGFHYPNQLPYRYSFLFSFLILLIVFRTLTVIREFSSKTLMMCAGFGILFTILAEELNNNVLQHGHAYLNIAFFLIYLLLLAMLWRPNYFRTTALLLAVVMVGELTVNTIVTVAKIAEKEVYTSRSAFIEGMDEIEQLTTLAKERENGDFYRMEILPAKTTNDGALYGYPGFTLFSSTSREATARLFRRLGYHGNNINSYKYVASTPVGNSLFGLKYLILKNSETRDPALQEVAKAGTMTLYENPYAIELGLVADPSFLNWNGTYSNPFQVWNDMIHKMDGSEDLFTPILPDVLTGSNYQPSTGDAANGLRFTPENRNSATLMNLEVKVEKDQYLYFAINTSKSTNIKISVSNPGGAVSDPSGSVPDPSGAVSEPSGGVSDPSGTSGLTVPESTVPMNETRSIHWLETFDVGYVHAGDVVSLSFDQTQDNSTDVTVYAATMDRAQYEAEMLALKDRELDVTTWESSYISADYTADGPGLIYLSIPYDTSWEARIDGKVVETTSIAETALLAVATDGGSHTLELTFRPQGIVPGTILTISGLLVLALLAFDERKFKPARVERRRIARAEKAARKAAEKEAREAAEKEAREAAGSDVRNAAVNLTSTVAGSDVPEATVNSTSAVAGSEAATVAGIGTHPEAGAGVRGVALAEPVPENEEKRDNEKINEENEGQV